MTAALDIKVSPRGLTRFFALVVTGLVLAHIAVQSVRFATGDVRLFGLVPFFSIGSDRNLPTFYSSVALLVCAGLLALIGRGTRGDRSLGSGYWFGLSAIFAFLALDEMLMLHEQLIDPLRTRLGTSGLLYYAWIIPYGALLLIFLLVYARFLCRLPRRTARRFILAGILFVGGAVGMEMLGGLQFEAHGGQNITYVLLQTVEETLEMAGIVVFIHALTAYTGLRCGSVRVLIVDHEGRTHDDLDHESRRSVMAITGEETSKSRSAG